MRNRGSEGGICGIADGQFPDPVTITLPKGETPSLSPGAWRSKGEGWARAGIVKDAGDDPDVTHGCMVVATVREGGHGIRFKAGPGVGMVTRAACPFRRASPPSTRCRAR